jgi:hypothetical protein
MNIFYLFSRAFGGICFCVFTENGWHAFYVVSHYECQLCSFVLLADRQVAIINKMALLRNHSK